MPRPPTEQERILADLQHVHKDICFLERETTKRYKAEATHSVFSRMNGSFKIILMYVDILSGDDDVSYEFAEYERRHWKGLSMHAHVDRDEVLNYTASQRTTLDWAARVASTTHSDYYFAAAKWIAEKNVYLELCELNAKGVSPPAHVLLERFAVAWMPISINARVSAYLAYLSTNDSARNFWLLQFRDKWLASFRVLPQRPPLSDATVIRKVPA